jgi:hypothetical protein
MIRKLRSGEYRLYSRKKNPKTNKRRNLGTFESLAGCAKTRARDTIFQASLILLPGFSSRFGLSFAICSLMGAWEITTLIIGEVLLTLAAFLCYYCFNSFLDSQTCQKTQADRHADL